MVLFKNNSFLSASIFLAVLGNAALLPSFSFGMDEETEKTHTLTSASAALPYPDERASIIEGFLSIFLNPQVSEEDRNTAGKSLLKEPTTLWEGSKQIEYNVFCDEQILLVAENTQISFPTRVAYAHSFLSPWNVPEGSFFHVPSIYRATPKTHRASAILLSLLSEHNSSLTPAYCTHILRDILDFGERSQNEEASRKIINFS